MRARLLEYSEIAPEIRHFLFEVPGVDRFRFAAGQFVAMSELLQGKKITRAYSIASPPSLGNRFELCLNRVKEGRFSPHLFAMQPGDEVDMKGPLGGFVWRNPVRDSVLIATGTGIAPMRSMLFDQLPKDKINRFTLVFGVRYSNGLLYAAEFLHLERQHPNFRFIPTVTRPEASWTGRVGRVQAPLLETIGERRDMDVYVCGLKEMVNDVRAQLLALGFERKQVVYERYD
jgi:CDP-4-dehydro-6-deoxyglucose reductase